MIDIKEALERAIKDGASDIFIIAGGNLDYKVQERIIPLDDSVRLMPDDTEVLITQIYELAHRSKDKYIQNKDDDFSFAVANLARFRVNAYWQRGSQAAVIRIVPFSIPDYREIGIPEIVIDTAKYQHGMIIVSGTAGSGKSTTQACLIDYINKTREAHVITLEDPIEYLHRNQKSIISQREISIDTQDYLSGIRSCLRQAPDVILVGEMRDYETIQIAMTAAETGHLVIATLHTQGAVNTIDRIIDSFSSNQQEQIRIQLSMVLTAVISQQLLPKIGGGMIPAVEVMKTNPAIKNMIRDSKIYQIESIMQNATNAGMILMDQSILDLYQKGLISKDTALEYASNREQMQRKL